MNIYSCGRGTREITRSFDGRSSLEILQMPVMLGKANFQIFLDGERVRETVENGPLCFAFDHVQRVRR